MNLHRLTPAERGILDAFAAGCRDNTQVALALKLSINTVRSHKRTIYSKLGLKDAYDFGRFVERYLVSGCEPVCSCGEQLDQTPSL